MHIFGHQRCILKNWWKHKVVHEDRNNKSEEERNQNLSIWSMHFLKCIQEHHFRHNTSWSFPSFGDGLLVNYELASNCFKFQINTVADSILPCYLKFHLCVQHLSHGSVISFSQCISQACHKKKQKTQLLKICWKKQLPKKIKDRMFKTCFHMSKLNTPFVR